MNLVQVPRGSWLGHELPEALAQRALAHQIRASGLGASLVVERGPFSQASRRIEVDVVVGFVVDGHRSSPLALS